MCFSASGAGSVTSFTILGKFKVSIASDMCAGVCLLVDSAPEQQPMMVYGHGVRFGCHRRWHLKGRSMYVIMVRHPLERLFSSFQQAQRDRNSVNHGKSLREYVSTCTKTKDIPGGSLLHYLTNKNLSGGVDVNENQALGAAEKLQIALAALDSGQILVLIHDRWSESMALLESYGILPRHAKNVDSLNSSPGMMHPWQRGELLPAGK